MYLARLTHKLFHVFRSQSVGLAILTSGSKQMPFPGISCLAARGSCEKAFCDLDQHMGDMETFRHREV